MRKCPFSAALLTVQILANQDAVYIYSVAMHYLSLCRLRPIDQIKIATLVTQVNRPIPANTCFIHSECLT